MTDDTTDAQPATEAPDTSVQLKPQRLRINRKGMRIAFSPQPMRMQRFMGGLVAMSGDGRAAYAREGGGLRRVAQTEDGTVVVVRKMSKMERKAERRAKRQTGRGVR